MKKNILTLLFAFTLIASAQWHLDFDEQFASASSAFTPLSLAPSLWLDASDASTITLTGTSVTNWVDKSGAGNHAKFVGASTTWPTACATQQNNRCTILFDGGDYLGTGFLSNTGTTVIAVVKRTAGEILCGARDVSSTRSFWGSDGGGAFRAGIGNDATIVSTSQWGSVYHVFGGRYDGANVVLRDNGVQTKTQAQNGSGINTTAGYYIGAVYLLDLSSPAAYLTGYVGEILCFRRALTDAEMKQVETYLGTRWGITVAP